MADLSGVFTNTFVNGTLADATEVNANFQDVLDFLNGDLNSYTKNAPILSPIGSIVAWHKTFGSADSGTTDGTTANKLVDSSQNFSSTISVGMVVYNSTDDTFANVTAVDSDTTLTLDSDIMVSGESYTIYKTPQLPDGWLECDGSVVSDADSPYNGVTLPDLQTNLIRMVGANSSGTTGGGAGTHNHTKTFGVTSGGLTKTEGYEGGSHEHYYMEVVWIIRIK